MFRKPWVGFDLDGTLAHYNTGDGIDTIGEPIPLMLALVNEFLNKGVEVKIVTARVSTRTDDPLFRYTQRHLIEEWCLKNIGQHLEVTAEKDFAMIALYDDRCKQVIPNTGQLVEDFLPDARM